MLLVSRFVLATVMTGAIIGSAVAQTPPPIATTKVEGTDNVYIFRNGNHQAMFIVTKDGVIATDPVAYGRPTAAKPTSFRNGATRRARNPYPLSRLLIAARAFMPTCDYGFRARACSAPRNDSNIFGQPIAAQLPRLVTSMPCRSRMARPSLFELRGCRLIATPGDARG